MRLPDRLGSTGILGCVPSQGSVGASGDLAPAAHAVQTILAEGERCTMPHDGRFIELPAAQEPCCGTVSILVPLGPKEGLSLVNGTLLTTAMARSRPGMKGSIYSKSPTWRRR